MKELLNKAKDNNISQIIVGWNKEIKTGGIKNESLKGKRRAKTNQKFISLPISKFKNKLIFKAAFISALIIVPSFLLYNPL